MLVKSWHRSRGPRRTFFDWATTTLLLVGATFVLGLQCGLGRLDQSFYDVMMALNPIVPRSDIVIVDIDQDSLNALGRWPWRRALIAKAIDQLRPARALAIDVIYTEPDTQSPGDDILLAQAIKQHGRVVLPLAREDSQHGTRFRAPSSPIGEAAAGLGHIDLAPESDGFVRRITLFEHDGQQSQPHIALAMTLIAQKALGQVLLPPTNSFLAPTLIPFSASDKFTRVSILNVLRGDIPSSFFENKYVLIGATAVGLGDSYPTPVSLSNAKTPGVDILASILNGLLNKLAIRAASPFESAVISALPVALVLIGFITLTPRLALALTFGFFVLVPCGSYLALHYGNTWIPPGATLIGLICCYPLWSWKRLEAAMRYLAEESDQLTTSTHLLPVIGKKASLGERSLDQLDRRIHALHGAISRSRDLSRFMSDVLNHLPDITFVTHQDGRIAIANQRAIAHFNTQRQERSDLVGLRQYDVLSTMLPPEQLLKLSMSSTPSDTKIDLSTVEITDGAEHYWLIKRAPCRVSSDEPYGCITSIVDISHIRHAEAQREEVLGFLSHDMRSPQSSIVALLQRCRDEDYPPRVREIFERIDRYARRTLSLADDFVQYARAKSASIEFEAVDLCEVVLDGIDDVWPLGLERDIVWNRNLPSTPAYVNANQSLMLRALVNLLSNAIKYSPRGGRITCTVERVQTNWIVAVHDTGIGITESDQLRLFQRFGRVSAEEALNVNGVGLGLLFVQTVLERHGGHAELESSPGRGTEIRMYLPIYSNMLSEMHEADSLSHSATSMASNSTRIS